MELRKISKEELEKVLELHKLWLNDEEGGKRADLSYTDLKGVDLSDINLSDAYLSHAILTGVRTNHLTLFFALQCPEEGSFIGYKKVKNKIVKLLIPEDAKRSSATSRKCRCSKAVVLSITSLDGKESFDEVINTNYNETIYKVDEAVFPDRFDENRWDECSNGIHFFITRDEAVNY